MKISDLESENLMHWISFKERDNFEQYNQDSYAYLYSAHPKFRLPLPMMTFEMF